LSGYIESEVDMEAEKEQKYLDIAERALQQLGIKAECPVRVDWLKHSEKR